MREDVHTGKIILLMFSYGEKIMKEYTYKDIEKELGITENAIRKRADTLHIEPIKRGLRVFFTEEDFDKLKSYKPKSLGRCLVRYRICVFEHGKWIVKHAGLSLNKATKLLRFYKDQGVKAIKKQCS